MLATPPNGRREGGWYATEGFYGGVRGGEVPIVPRRRFVVVFASMPVLF